MQQQIKDTIHPSKSLFFFLMANSIRRRVRYYCGTWNNPDDVPAGFVAILNNRIHCRYWIFSKERASTGTVHYQFYIELKRPDSMTSLIEKLGKPVWLQERRGTRSEARDYCRKMDETHIEGPWEGGEWREEEEKKKTTSDLVEAVKSGKSLLVVTEEFPSFAFWGHKQLLSLYQMYEPEHKKNEVILCVGETGLGKSRSVWEMEDWGLTVGACHLPWFDGYLDQNVLLIDEFNSAITLQVLLRVLDRYRVLLPVKGGFIWRRSSIIVITSNSYPKEWYDYRNRMSEYDALCRRIDRVVVFKKGLNPIINEDYDYWRTDSEGRTDHVFVWDKRNALAYHPSSIADYVDP